MNEHFTLPERVTIKCECGREYKIRPDTKRRCDCGKLLEHISSKIDEEINGGILE